MLVGTCAGCLTVQPLEAAEHNLLDDVGKVKRLQEGQVHNFLDWRGEKSAQVELAFAYHQSVSVHIQEKMAEMREEEHSNPKVKEWHLMGETPLEQKMVVDLQKVELVVALAP